MSIRKIEPADQSGDIDIHTLCIEIGKSCHPLFVFLSFTFADPKNIIATYAIDNHQTSIRVTLSFNFQEDPKEVCKRLRVSAEKLLKAPLPEIKKKNED